MDADRLLADLNDEQVAAVTSDAAPLAILAGAGSGKTRVLTRRLAWRAATDRLDPRRALVLTFTRKAAGELGDRVRALGLRDTVAAGTFHAVAYAQLRRRWADQGARAPELLDRKVGFVAKLDREGGGTEPVEVVGEIEWAKARLITPERYPTEATAAGRRPVGGVETVARRYLAYEEAKRRRRLVDFDDLLALCRRAVDTDPEHAAAVRWRAQHLFVDEFQDVNPLQFALLRAWLGDRTDLCVVGDPNQAIYGWNGADADFLVRFEHWFPGGGSVSMRRNHRSTPQILHVAAAVLRSAAPLSTRPDGSVPLLRGFEDEAAEARGVARAVRDAHAPGRPWRDQAVLVRTNAQLAVIEETLRSRGIPCRTRSGSGLLDRPEIAGVLRRWRRADRVPLAVAVRELDAEIRLGEVEGDDDEQARVLDDERRASLGVLERIARDHLALDPEASASRFAAWLGASRGGLDDAGADAVELATFHGAKGLEWPVVHLAGLEEGLVPIAHARTRADVAEERRLLYVAVTRAEQQLFVSWAASRTLGSRPRRREPSPWLEPMAGAVAELERLGLPADGPRHVAEIRRQLHVLTNQGELAGGDPVAVAPPAADEALREAILAWRSATARAASVPAYVVFDDRTLEALVASRPADRDGLLALPGLGSVRVARYGEELLTLLAEHAR